MKKNDFELPGYNRLHNNVGSPFFSDKNVGYYLFLTYNPIFDTTNIILYQTLMMQKS